MKVIELGISREQLPTTISKEIEIIEAKIKSVFTGKFDLIGSGLGSLKIGWVDGMWHSTVLNQKTINGGGSNCYGLPGGRLFLIPGRSVTIEDFKIDLLGIGLDRYIG